MTIEIDDEDIITNEFDFVGANVSLIFEFTRFMSYKKVKLNVTVTLDIDEIREFRELETELFEGQ